MIAVIGFYNFPLQINITNLYFLLVWGEKLKWQIDIQIEWVSKDKANIQEAESFQTLF